MDSFLIAKQLCHKLRHAGHTAYFAGGYVRDKLLGIACDDIDIATSASPEEIASLFPDHVMIGAQFGVVLVLSHGYQFEVATFRSDAAYVNGRTPTAVTLKSTPEEDAERRDFTINGMFYDPEKDTISDFVGGKADLEKGIIRTIGNPLHRFQEDRLRMIRACRFAARFGFPIEKKTRLAILEMAPSLLPAVSMERIFQEFTKMRAFPNFTNALLQMHALNILPTIFPPLKEVPLYIIEERLLGTELFSKEVPMLLFLARLFSDEDALYVRDLPKYLKASNEEGRFIECFLRLKTVELHAQDRYTLACLMAEGPFKAAFEALSPTIEDRVWLAKEEQALKGFIEWARTKEWPVKGSDLEAMGVLPGKEMGRLLEEARRLAVNKNLTEKEAILRDLFRS